MDAVDPALAVETTLRDLRRWGVEPSDDEQLLWAAAVGTVVQLWRNSVWERWHDTDWGLREGEMMRSTAATVKLVRGMLSPNGTDWTAIAAALTQRGRRLPDGRTLVEYAGARRLARLAAHTATNARLFTGVEADYGAHTALLAAASCSMWALHWHGMPDWARRVDAFCAAVADPTHPHWADGRWRLPAARPDDIADDTRLRTLLLAGPDTLSAVAARWCLIGGLEKL